MENIDFEIIGIEYHKTMLLKTFSQLCCDMKNPEFDKKIRRFYRNSADDTATTNRLFLSYYNISLSKEDCEFISTLVKAHLRKLPKRMSIPESIKTQLLQSQNGKCALCGKELGTDLSIIHVDHIIPWELVGDELENNFQDLCQKCNLEKKNKVDYVFKKLLKLV